MPGAPYREATGPSPATRQTRWYVPASGLWFLALSAWLLVAARTVRTPHPTLFCERVASTTQCWYHDDATLLPRVLPVDGVDIQVEQSPSGKSEGLYRIGARRMLLVTGSEWRRPALAPARDADGECIIDARLAATAFLSGTAGPRMVIRFNEEAPNMSAISPAILIVIAMIIAVAQLSKRTRKLVIDRAHRRVSIHSIRVRVVFDLEQNETLEARQLGDATVIVAVGSANTQRDTSLGAHLNDAECRIVAAACNDALAGKAPRRLGVVAVVPAVVALIALAVLDRIDARPSPLPEWAATPRAACAR